MSKKYILISLVVFISVFFICFGAEAMVGPEIYFTDISLEKDNFKPGEEIKGTVSLWNYEQSVMPDLVFYFQLLADKVEGIPSKTIHQEKGKEVFTLVAGEKTTKTFSYNLPANLPEGDLVFSIQLTNSRGERMSGIDKDISVESEGKFLTLDNYWLIKKGGSFFAEVEIDLESEEIEELKERISKEPDNPFLDYFPKAGEETFHPLIGVNFKPDEIPEAVFDVTNDSSFTISAFYKIITYRRNVGNVLKEEKGETITLEPGEKKTQNVSLSGSEKPETYLSEIKFYDSETQEPISNSIYLRWVIYGEDDVEILFVKPDKVSYEKGEEALIELNLSGPAGIGILSAGEGIVEVKLFDQEERLVGQASKKVELNAQKMMFNIPLERGVDNPRIETKIIKGDKVLDEYGFGVNAEIEEEKLGFFEKNKWLIISILVLILILLIVIMIINCFKMKKRSIDISLILLFLFAACFLFSGSDVLAAFQVARDCDDSKMVWYMPGPNKQFNPGDIVRFKGVINANRSVDEFAYSRLNFYITEDKWIPVIDCCGNTPILNECSRNTCLTCTEPGLDPEIQRLSNWGINLVSHTRVKYLDKTRGYRIHKLGEITGSGIWRYDKSFNIPSGFSGPVRFYIEFVGAWGDYIDYYGWPLPVVYFGWNVSYQKGHINRAPVANAGPDREVYENESIILNGSGSSDPDGNPITYQWSCTGGSLSNSKGRQPRYYAPSVNQNTNYWCTLTVRDNKGLFDSDTMKVKVKNKNRPPTANAGPDKEIYENESVILNGSGSDPDGDPITYQWSCNGGSLSNHYIARPRFYAPSVDQDTNYWCTLTVRDNKGLFDSDTMKVKVKSKLPYVENPSSNEEYCGINPGAALITFEWTYRSDDDKNQSHYYFAISKKEDLSDPWYDVTRIQPGEDNSINRLSINMIPSMEYNETYYWGVKVKDVNGNWSLFSDINSFIVPKHAYPWTDFDWSLTGSDVSFEDKTIYYNGAKNWKWDFDYDGTTMNQDSTGQNPTHSYPKEGNYTVRLEATDSDGYMCPMEKDIAVEKFVGERPTAINLDKTEGNYCFVSSPPIRLNWTFSDPDPGDTQSAYQIQIIEIGAITIDTCEPYPGTCGPGHSSDSYAPSNLDFNTHYWWKLKVQDSQGVWSDGWIFPEISSFITDSRWPWPEFKCNDQDCEDISFRKDEEILFTNLTTDCDPCKYKWDFGDGNVITVYDKSPQSHSYSVVDDYTVELTATDISTPENSQLRRVHSCTKPHDIATRLKPPRWWEIPPF